MVLSMFGHHIDDKDVLQLFKQKRLAKKKSSLYGKLKMVFMAIDSVLFSPTKLIQLKTQMMDNKKDSVVHELQRLSTANDIWKALSDKFFDISKDTRFHGPVSMSATLKNMVLKFVLESALPNNPDMDSDYNLMVSSCNDVISAEVPNSLREIAKSIKDKQWFRQLSDEEALQVLQTGSDESSHKFRYFLDRHGHRGYREFDPMYHTWKEDPIPCVKTIKGLLSGNESQLEPKVSKSVDQVMEVLKTPLSFIKKLLIRKVLLPWSRRGVGYRELSKEGLIPSAECFFYLTVNEVEALCSGDRDPLILTRVRQRRRLYPKMDKYKFEEFIKGPEMKPRNFEDQIIPPVLSSAGRYSDHVLDGHRLESILPITFGYNHRNRLITYSTDIGWSPYFPLLSGIITEIGGTISHGAVIAREYGIPSLIAVEGACRAFRTGDICLLDTKTQTITKIE
ncbi:unnamed protein product [Medioppia subpectinata]|uniref:PEP-utilising enzyme mobile domain-containing protein n=1 Tax=Medioppia subpectinata TaxID=1979941 RepID=A0A7R9QBF7_9ACAR|nr:unnamed protein product [Medioppia subpectinata]CAG2117807.1 unnamed protein product [Medioppia subpectinata]